jgi:hypothetical protein
MPVSSLRPPARASKPENDAGVAGQSSAYRQRRRGKGRRGSSEMSICRGLRRSPTTLSRKGARRRRRRMRRFVPEEVAVVPNPDPRQTTPRPATQRYPALPAVYSSAAPQPPWRNRAVDRRRPPTVPAGDLPQSQTESSVQQNLTHTVYYTGKIAQNFPEILWQLTMKKEEFNTEIQEQNCSINTEIQ